MIRCVTAVTHNSHSLFMSVCVRLIAGNIFPLASLLSSSSSSSSSHANTPRNSTHTEFSVRLQEWVLVSSHAAHVSHNVTICYIVTHTHPHSHTRDTHDKIAQRAQHRILIFIQCSHWLNRSCSPNFRTIAVHKFDWFHSVCCVHSHTHENCKIKYDDGGQTEKSAPGKTSTCWAFSLVAKTFICSVISRICSA